MGFLSNNNYDQHSNSFLDWLYLTIYKIQFVYIKKNSLLISPSQYKRKKYDFESWAFKSLNQILPNTHALMRYNLFNYPAAFDDLKYRQNIKLSPSFFTLKE